MLRVNTRAFLSVNLPDCTRLINFSHTVNVCYSIKERMYFPIGFKHSFSNKQTRQQSVRPQERECMHFS